MSSIENFTIKIPNSVEYHPNLKPLIASILLACLLTYPILGMNRNGVFASIILFVIFFIILTSLTNENLTNEYALSSTNRSYRDQTESEKEEESADDKKEEEQIEGADNKEEEQVDDKEEQVDDKEEEEQGEGTDNKEEPVDDKKEEEQVEGVDNKKKGQSGGKKKKKVRFTLKKRS